MSCKKSKLELNFEHAVVHSANALKKRTVDFFIWAPITGLYKYFLILIPVHL